jgi:tetratricopeptide (TPR) repeat protein
MQEYFFEIFQGIFMLRTSLVHLFLIACFISSAVAQEDPIALFNQGQDAQEKGDNEAAIKFYDQALKLLPEFPEAEYQKATAYFSLKKLVEAEKAFRKAIELRSDWTLPMANLGALLVRKNSFAEADKFLTQAISIDDSNSIAYVALAELRIKTKSTPEILRTLLVKISTLTSKQRPSAAVWASRGSLERALNESASAKISLRKALEIEPLNQSALADSVEISLAESDYTRATDDAKLLVANSPTPQNRYLLARCYAESGKADDALRVLEMLDNADLDVVTLKNAITTAASTDVFQLEQRLEKSPKDLPLLSRLCKVTRTTNAEKSMEYCRRALELEPTNVNHAVGFAGALVKAKQYENAIAVSRKILEISPENYTARANLAISLFQLKRYEEAKSDYQWLANAKPQISIAYYFLAICHDNLQEYTDAMANYQRFLTLVDPKVNQLEIDKVNLRLPILQKQIKNGEGRKKK